MTSNRQELTSLLVINVLIGSASGIVLLALPLYALTLRVSAAQLGLITGMAGAGRLLIVLPSGIWADRYGTRSLFVAGTLCCALCSALVPLADGALQLGVLVFFQGMAQSVGFMTLQAGFLKRLKYLDQSQAGWQRSATQLGYFLIAPLLGGAVVSGNRFTATFLLVALLMLAGLAVVLYRQYRGIGAAWEDAPSQPTSQYRQFRRLLANRYLQQVLLIEFLGAAVFMTFRTFLAPIALNALHLSLDVVAWVIALQGTCAMCFLFWGGRAVGGRSAQQTFLIAAQLVTLGTVLMASAGGALALLAGSLIYGAGTGLLSYVSLTRLTLVEGEKGKIAALFSLSVALGNLGGPVVAGYAAELIGLQAAFLVPAWLMLLPLAWLGWFNRSHKRGLKAAARPDIGTAASVPVYLDQDVDQAQ